MPSFPRRSVVTKPQWRRQARWVLTRGWGWPTAATSWPTERSPSSSSSRIWSLVGSPRTLKKRAAAAACVGARTVEYISGKQDITCTGPTEGAPQDFAEEEPNVPRVTVDRFTDAIAQAMPPLTARQLDLVLAAYRAMLTGEPAEVSAIATGAEWDKNEAAAQLSDWPGVYFDENGRVIVFRG